MISEELNSIPSIWGSLIFNTSLSLDELGGIVSEVMFCGLPFVGLDKNIYDEVPAVFIEGQPLGLKIILSGAKDYGYTLEVQSYFRDKEVKNERVYVDGYLFEFFKSYLQLSEHDIGIIATKRYGSKRFPEF